MALNVFTAGTTQPTHESADLLMASLFFALPSLSSLAQNVFLNLRPRLTLLFVFVQAVRQVDGSTTSTVVIWTTPVANELGEAVVPVENFRRTSQLKDISRKTSVRTSNCGPSDATVG